MRMVGFFPGNEAPQTLGWIRGKLPKKSIDLGFNLDGDNIELSRLENGLIIHGMIIPVGD